MNAEAVHRHNFPILCKKKVERMNMPGLLRAMMRDGQICQWFTEDNKSYWAVKRNWGWHKCTQAAVAAIRNGMATNKDGTLEVTKKGDEYQRTFK